MAQNRKRAGTDAAAIFFALSLFMCVASLDQPELFGVASMTAMAGVLFAVLARRGKKELESLGE